MTLSFLEANKVVTKKNNLPTNEFVLAASSQTEKLEAFIKACCIQKGFNCIYSVLPFNTLSQYVYQDKQSSAHHVFFLAPWDLVPQIDWRTGVPSSSFDYQQSIKDAHHFLNAVASFPSFQIVYLAAPVSPPSRNNILLTQLEQELRLLASSQHASIMSENYFSLTSYLTSGGLVTGAGLYNVANNIAEKCCPDNQPQKKVLITDLDNVMWKGIIGEDGLDGIKYEPEGAGYVHYIYQTLLNKLKQEGVLIAAVTRNDETLACSPFDSNLTFFKKDSFVAFMASYNAKSSQLESLSSTLNLPLDCFVFIDDNPIEIEEVSKQLPEVTCITFPEKTEAFPEFIAKIQRNFHQTQLTEDDPARTEMYKARGRVSIVSEKPGANLDNYLNTLDMSISYTKCSKNNYHRALQLINKTNQFNLNGKRLKESELLNIMENKETSLIIFSLKDRFGDHGQVCCFLLQDINNITHFVMSCRIFQRKLEYAAILILFTILKVDKLTLEHTKTDRNIPMQTFLAQGSSYDPEQHHHSIDRNKFENKFKEYLELFHYIDKNNLS